LPSFFLFIDIDDVDRWGTFALVLILAVSSALRLLAAEIGWPKWLVRHFDARRRQEIVAVVDELGIRGDVGEAMARQRLITRLDKAGAVADPVSRIEHLLAIALREGSYVVGRGNQMTFDYFIDVMSSSLRPEYAERCASALVTYLRDRPGPENVVVGLTSGSPLLASEVARLLDLPLALYRGARDLKYRDAAGKGEVFDGDLTRAEKVLIVDDSTTSGRKVVDCVAALRERGIEVERCVVLFQPVGKDPAAELAKNGVELIAPVILDQKTLKRIRKFAEEA
jgi:orotate phosphoribosyltransferase